MAKLHWLLACGASFTLGAVVVAQQAQPARTPPRTLFSTQLSDVPGKSLTVVELNFAPNAAPPSTLESHARGHRHPGSVYVYVTEGAVRLGLAGQTPRVVEAGNGFFEPPGARHIINENASSTRPARAIAVMLVPDGQPLTLPDQE